MKLLNFIVFLLLGMVTVNSQPAKPVGVNLNSALDYSPEFIFTDAAQQGRRWISFNADGTGDWDTGVNITLTETGYPVEIPYDNGVNPPQKVRTLLLWDLNDEATITGQYRLIVEGTGQVKLDFGASGVFDCPVDTYVSVDGGVAIEIVSSDVNDPISDIKFILPGYGDTFQDKLFTDELLTFLEDFQLIRFMDWAKTNNSDVVTWDDRSKADYYTQNQKAGVAWEYVVELCNQTDKDAWINIPHLADDNYITQLATFLEANLDDNLKIYIEYSNEIWNSIFSQHSETAQLALDFGYTGQQWERAWKYTAKRSADVFVSFESVFEDHSRLVKVIPSQSANSWISNQIITFFKDEYYNPEQVTADALAIAPYFAGSVADQIVEDGLVETITVDEIIQLVENSLDDAYSEIGANKTVADNQGLDLICYEGGQHLAGTFNNANITTLTQKLIATNRHADMQNIYCQYLNYWYENAGGMFAHFSSHSSYNKYGSWGLKEYMDDLNNPKYLAIQDCVFAANIDDTGISFPELNQTDIRVFPNPSTDNIIHIEGSFNVNEIKVYDVIGRSIDFEILEGLNQKVSIKAESNGIILIKVGKISRLVILNN